MLTLTHTYSLSRSLSLLDICNFFLITPFPSFLFPILTHSFTPRNANLHTKKDQAKPSSHLPITRGNSSSSSPPLCLCCRRSLIIIWPRNLYFCYCFTLLNSFTLSLSIHLILTLPFLTRHPNKFLLLNSFFFFFLPSFSVHFFTISHYS